MFKSLLPLSLGLFLTFSQVAAMAQEPLNAIDGVAMDGFDVVAYFESGAPEKGLDAHTLEYKGATWKFSSADNARAFAAEPRRYEPQFNGWCAYAVSEGYSAEVDFIDGWSVLDDRLYLNWSASVRKGFIRDQNQRRPRADANWSNVRAGLIDGSIEVQRHKRVFGVGIEHPQELPGS